MDTRRWFEVPAADIPVDGDSVRLAEALRPAGTYTPGRWQLHDSMRIFSAADPDAKMRRVVGTGKYHPAVAKVPWSARWKTTTTASNYDGLTYIDTPEGHRYGLWMPTFPATTLWGLVTLWGTVGAGAAWLCSAPALDSKGRVVAGEPVDLRTYRGNDPRCNGAGVIPRPVTRAELDAGRIGHALSLCVPNTTFGPRGLVRAPAGKIEGGPGSMSVGGVRVSWTFDDEDLDGALVDVEPRWRADVLTVCAAMREFGGTVDLTGPNAGIVCADTGLPRDGLARVVERVGWRVHVAPVGYRLGERIGSLAGWYDDIRYEPR